MEDQVEREGAEVEECRQEAPVLFSMLVATLQGSKEGMAYLILIEHRAEGVEELEGGDDLALYER
jgi:hypothetical protein